MNSKFRNFLVREGLLREGDRWEDPQLAAELLAGLEDAAQQYPELGDLVQKARMLVDRPMAKKPQAQWGEPWNKKGG